MNKMNVQDLGSIIAKEAEEGDTETNHPAIRAKIPIRRQAHKPRPATIQQNLKVAPPLQCSHFPPIPLNLYADSQAPRIQDTAAESSFCLEGLEENLFGKASKRQGAPSAAHKLPGINVWG